MEIKADKEILNLFLSESTERMNHLNQHLLSLEKKVEPEIVQAAMREAHTLKGAARWMGLKEMEKSCHELETVIQKIGQGEKLFDVCFKRLDEIKNIVEQVGVQSSELSSEKKQSAPSLSRSPDVVSAPIGTDEVVRLPFSRLQQVLFSVDEFIFHVRRLGELVTLLEKGLRKIQTHGEIKNPLLQLQNKISEMDTLSERLTFRLRSLSVSPLLTLFEELPRVVRDLSVQLGKKVQMDLYGGDVELDKGLIQALKSSVIHCLRNSVDHGIESPDERRRSGKKEEGRIGIKGEIKGDRFYLEIVDDGRGIDVEVLKRRALEAKLISPEDIQQVSREKLYGLLFASGFSTRTVATEVSGRGVGLDSVARDMACLGGTVEVRSEKGKGTTLLFSLPLKLGVQRVVICRVGDYPFAFYAERISSVKKELPQDSTIKIHDMAHLWLGHPSHGPIVVVSFGALTRGFRVDEVVGEQECMIKTGGNWMQKIAATQAFAVPSAFEVIPLIEPMLIAEERPEVASPFLKEMDAQSFTLPRHPEAQDLCHPEARRAEGSHLPTILVVEDSDSFRAYLSALLKKEGYSVVEASDGLEAQKLFHQQPCHAVITDRMMPGLDGLALCEWIRRQKIGRDIPIIMVTSMPPQNHSHVQDMGLIVINKQNFDIQEILKILSKRGILGAKRAA